MVLRIIKYVVLRIIKYVGQKFTIAKWIISHFPKHKYYVEVFGGSAAVLLTKPISPIEVYNDLNNDLYLFMLYVKLHPYALYEEITHYPYARQLVQDLKKMKGHYLTELERVVRWWFLNISTVNGNQTSFSGITADKRISQTRNTIINRLFAVSERLQKVIIENLDYKKLIEKYDEEDTLFYLDPPYILSSNKQGEYYKNKDWNNLETHQELFEILQGIKGKAIVSYYPHEFINKTYLKSGWYIDQIEVTSYAHPRNRDKKIELLLMNFDYTKEAEFYQKKIINFIDEGVQEDD